MNFALLTLFDEKDPTNLDVKNDVRPEHVSRVHPHAEGGTVISFGNGARVRYHGSRKELSKALLAASTENTVLTTLKEQVIPALQACARDVMELASLLAQTQERVDKLEDEPADTDTSPTDS